MMNKEDLRELLVEKYDYKNSQVDSVVEKIIKFSPKVAEAFNIWLASGEIDGTEAAGYTVKDILAKRPMKTVAAYLTLDWLERDPEEASEALDEPLILDV
jgi:hypothetical protein